MLTELTPIVVTASMREELARHLRLSSGLSVDQDAEVDAAFRDAIAHLELRLSLCISPRNFVWRTYLDGEGRVRAPLGPMREIVSIQRVRSDGALEEIGSDRFELDHLETRPSICVNLFVPDEVEITFAAGFGEGWESSPPDIRRAVLLLAAHYFDKRHASGESEKAIPHGVAALTAPWRPVRISARGAA